jgi:hypothetical protein
MADEVLSLALDGKLNSTSPVLKTLMQSTRIKVFDVCCVRAKGAIVSRWW